MQRPRSLKDILAGLIFIGFGLAFGIAAARLPDRHRAAHGAGLLPAGARRRARPRSALAIVVKGLLAAAADGALGRGALARAWCSLTAALVFFGATVRGLGLAPGALRRPPSSARSRAGATRLVGARAARGGPDRSSAC